MKKTPNLHWIYRKILNLMKNIFNTIEICAEMCIIKIVFLFFIDLEKNNENI